MKWLEKIELLEADRLGFWEADIGYHNNADPWAEERFIAGNVSKAEATKLIEAATSAVETCEASTVRIETWTA